MQESTNNPKGEFQCTLLTSKLTLIIVLFTAQIKSIQKTLNELILICLGITINNRSTAAIHDKLVELRGIIETIYSTAVKTTPEISGVVNEPLTKCKQDIIELETSIIIYQQSYPRNTEEVRACLAKSATSIATLREAVGGNSRCVWTFRKKGFNADNVQQRPPVSITRYTNCKWRVMDYLS